MLVRFIPTDRHPKMGWSGNKPALCFKGTKNAHCVVIGEAEIQVVDLPISIVEGSRIVIHPEIPGTPYPPERFVERVIATRKPLTPEARKLLESINGSEAPIPTPPRPKKSAPVSKSGKPDRTAGSALISQIAEDLGIPSPKLRRFLRSQGLSAPYTDEKRVRATVKKYPKEKTSGKTTVQKGSKIQKGAGT